MFDKTFDSSIVEANRQAVETNLEIAYDGAGRRAERLAKDLDSILEDYGQKFS